jgi:hypothetical protein
MQRVSPGYWNFMNLCTSPFFAMINNGTKEIIPTDPHFDLIPEIKKTDPQKLK